MLACALCRWIPLDSEKAIEACSIAVFIIHLRVHAQMHNCICRSRIGNMTTKVHFFFCFTGAGQLCCRAGGAQVPALEVGNLLALLSSDQEHRLTAQNLKMHMGGSTSGSLSCCMYHRLQAAHDGRGGAARAPLPDDHARQGADFHACCPRKTLHISTPCHVLATA